MVEERTQQPLVCADLVEGADDLIGERAGIVRDVVDQVGIVRVRPDLFHRVEFRGVGRKPLDLNLGTETVQEPPHTRSMDGPAIHHQDDSAANLMSQPTNVSVSMLWSWMSKYSPRRRRSGETVIAEMADNRSRRSQL